MKIDPLVYDRLIRYCTYQERSISEVKKKMYALELHEDAHDSYLQLLQEDDFQNETRFTNSFIDGKFRMKGWGSNKIKSHLKAKGVSDELISAGLEALNQEEYLKNLQDLASSKLEKVKGKNDYERKAKVYRFLLQRGYESSLIHKILFQ